MIEKIRGSRTGVGAHLCLEVRRTRRNHSRTLSEERVSRRRNLKTMSRAAIRSVTMRAENCLLDIVMWIIGRDGKNRQLHWGVLLKKKKDAENWVSYCTKVRI